MPRKKQLTIIAIAALVVSVSALYGGVVTATTPTTVTIAASNTKPAVSQAFTISGTLKAGSTALAGKTIKLGRWDPSGTWSADGTTTTDSTGAYSFTIKESVHGNYRYQAVFAGNTTYAESYAEVSVAVGNLRASAISIFASNSAPAVNQSFTLHGVLQDGESGAPLARQPISLLIRYPSGKSARASTTTDSNGAYSFTRRESAQGPYTYYVGFAGNSSYCASQTMLGVTVGSLTPTKLSLNITVSNPDVNQLFTISGYLTNINGTRLSGKPLTVDTRLPTGQWSPRGQMTTNSNGYYSVTLSEQTPGQYRYEVHFKGDGTYAAFTGGVEVSIGALQATTVSISATPTHPAVGQSFTLAGTLTDAKGTLPAGKEVDVYQYVYINGQQKPIGTFQTRYTDQNGHYSLVLNESASGNYIFTAWFIGDQTYACSYASVSLVVGTLTPTTVTITTTNTKPAVNQAFTLSGTLKAGTTPLSGKTITLGRTDPSGKWSSGGTTTTNSNGAYSFTRSESTQGKYWYQAVFAGDTTHSGSHADRSVNVGA